MTLDPRDAKRTGTGFCSAAGAGGVDPARPRNPTGTLALLSAWLHLSRAVYSPLVYSTLLGLHSALRWVVLALALVTLFRAMVERRRSVGLLAVDRRLTLALTVVLDIEVTLGLVLYLVYGRLGALMANPGGLMADPGLRFWTVEHGGMMLAALVLAHVGRVAVRRAKRASEAYRSILLYYGIATVLILLAIPWPFVRQARPLLRTLWG